MSVFKGIFATINVETENKAIETHREISEGERIERGKRQSFATKLTIILLLFISMNYMANVT